MHRLSRGDLNSLIYVAITTAPAGIQRGLKSKLQADREKARKELTALICDKIDNGSSMVVVAEMIGDPHHARPGKWGVDETDPTKR